MPSSRPLDRTDHTREPSGAIRSVIAYWDAYRIYWQDGGRPTEIRARTQLEAEQIARRFAVVGRWQVDRVVAYATEKEQGTW